MAEGQHRRDRGHHEGPVVGLTGARFGGAAGRRLREAEPPPDEELPVDAVLPGEQIPGERRAVVGQAGARFPRSEDRRRLTRPEPDQRQSAQPSQPGTGRPVPGFGLEDPPGEGERVVDEADWEGLAESYGLVRPYSWTKGRTTSRHDLAVEALISASGRNLDAAAGPEHHAILQLCSTPRSVAEVAALLSVPLAVARVLLGDMAEAGSVIVHRTAGSEGAPTLAVMQRVLSCLHRL